MQHHRQPGVFAGKEGVGEVGEIGEVGVVGDSNCKFEQGSPIIEES